MKTNKKGRTTSGAIEDFRPNVPTQVEPKLDIPKITISIVFKEEVNRGSKQQQRGIIKVYPYELEKTLHRYRSKDPIILDK